ncbi:MAG: hypothetical protein LBR87_04195, partial [Synergistaceae bacterium]|nr:hypothetical protein [Synergistaceae bacterium]
MSKKVQTVVVVLLLAAATAFILKGRTPEWFAGENGDTRVIPTPAGGAPSAADAIPAAGDSALGEYAEFFVSAGDTGSIASLMSVLTGVSMPEAPKDFIDAVDLLVKFISSADELSVYIGSGGRRNFYASMFMDGGKLGEFISDGDGRILDIENLEEG